MKTLILERSIQGHFNFTGVEVGTGVDVGRLVNSTMGVGVQVGGSALIVAVGVGTTGPRDPGGGKGLTRLPGFEAMTTIQRTTKAVTARMAMDILSQPFNFIPSPFDLAYR
jgi:hypothetical protein